MGSGYDEELSEEEEKFFEGLTHPIAATICELRDTSPVGNYWLTITIIIINVLVAMLTGGILFMNTVFAYNVYPSSACLASGGCFLELLLSMFSHVNVFHLAGNMAFLYVVGDNVEITLGRPKYLLVYLVSGIVGGYTQATITLALNPGGASVPMLGASAAISGLIGSYLILYPGAAMCKCIGFRIVWKCFKIKAAAYLSLWVFLQFLYVLIFPFIAIWAHLGGFFTGLALTYVLVSRERVRELRKELARGVYRGFSPTDEELHTYSLSPAARLIVASASIITLMLILASTAQIITTGAGYYVRYVEYESLCTYVSCFQSFGKELKCFCNGCSLQVLGTRYEILPTEPNMTPAKITEPPCPPSRVWVFTGAYSLRNALITSTLLSLIFIILTALTLHVMRKGYKEVEVTYILPTPQESQEKLT